MKNKKNIKKGTKKWLIKQLEETAWAFVKTIVDTTPNPFLILDPDLRVIAANKYFYRTFKVSPKETENRLIYDLGGGQWNIPKLKLLLEEILPKKTYFRNLEVEHDFPEIGHKVMLLNARRIYEAREIPRMISTSIILLVIEDITDSRKSREALVVKERAINKIKKELIQQRKIDKIKSEFVSLASHQLRTPLTSVKWYSKLLSEKKTGRLNQKQNRYVKEIYQSNERMIDLVRNLLNVSRIEMGVLAVSVEPTDIRKILEEVTKEQVPYIQEKKHKVFLKIPEGLPKISTDSSLLRMVVRNIFGNAVEYTPAGGKITCTLEKNDKEIIIGIEDTGIGIPKKQQKQIFQKFFRGDNAIKGYLKGTGLELYITKAMVDALSGKIWFKSKEGGGTTFWIALPFKGPKTHSGQKIINNHNGQNT